MNSNDYNREKIMNLIAAVDNNWAIGKNNQLLVRIPMDQKFFREMTTGKVVVMGRKTLESFPNSRPLKNRTNIVLTHNPSYEVEGAVVVHSLDELHKELEKYNSEDIYIIGGQKIYEQLVDECFSHFFLLIKKHLHKKRLVYVIKLFFCVLNSHNGTPVFDISIIA